MFYGTLPYQAATKIFVYAITVVEVGYLIFAVFVSLPVSEEFVIVMIVLTIVILPDLINNLAIYLILMEDTATNIKRSK